jgi:hypothetical protein
MALRLIAARTRCTIALIREGVIATAGIAQVIDGNCALVTTLSYPT